MKLMRILILVLMASTFTYCSDDATDDSIEQSGDDGNDSDDGDTGDNSDNGSSSESNALNADVVANGLRINGATQITALPPQATGGIDFSFDGNPSALIGQGFEQYIESDDTFDGVYLIIKDINGNTASSYYDIPADAFGRNAITSDRAKSIFNNERATRMVNEGLLDVGFNNSITPGRFCYAVCVYDGNGNISQPQEVCITVESFGGNDDLVGEWSMTNYTDVYDGQTVSAGLNEEYCYNDTINCNNGGSVNVQECSIFERLRFTFNADGTYVLDERVIDNDIDYDATVSTCTEVEQAEMFYEYLSSGSWAFNDTSGKLLTVETSYLENDNGDIFTDNYATGDGEVLFDIAITISGNSFTIMEDYNDGSGDSYSISFEK